MVSSDKVSCEECKAGTFSFNNTCEQCETGRYSVQSSSKCTRCTKGQEPTALQTGCNLCAKGRFSPGGEECVLCAIGRYSNEASFECSICNKGFESNVNGLYSTLFLYFLYLTISSSAPRNWLRFVPWRYIEHQRRPLHPVP